MNSNNIYSDEIDKKEASNFNKSQSVDLNLTSDQYLYLQHYLPKGFALIQPKLTKRNKKDSALNFIDNDNLSKLSGLLENNEEGQSRIKRERSKIKKVDRYLQDDLPRQNKRGLSETIVELSEEMKLCQKILKLLKKNPNARPFLTPVDPKTSGATNYLQIVANPMDLSTIQKNLKTGTYQNINQFHQDIDLIWRNSYTYNEKNSKIYRLTSQMEHYYKKITNQIYNKNIFKQQKIKIKSYKNTGVKIKKHQSSHTLFDRLSRLPQIAVSQIMDLLSQSGKNQKQKIQLDFDNLDQQTVKQIQEYIKAAQLKYKISQPIYSQEQQNQNYDSNNKI